MKKFQEYFLYFMLYSVIGWCYEVFLEVVVYRWGFSNRGILFGPYCVVYGFGALILMGTLKWLKEKGIYTPELAAERGHKSRKSVYNTCTCFCRYCCSYHPCGIGGKLYYGIYQRILDVGLYPIRI